MSDTFLASLEGQSRDEENKEENNRKSHGEKCESSSNLDASGNSKEDHKPSEGSVPDIGGYDATGRSQSVIGDGRSTNDIRNKVIDGFTTSQVGIVPWGVWGKCVKEPVDDPSNQDDIVGIEHETTSDRSKSNSSQSGMEGTKDTDISVIAR